MNLFIGFDNISSTVSDLKRCFRDKGHHVFFAMKQEPSRISLNDADFILENEINKFPLFKPRRISSKLKARRAQKIKDSFLKDSINHFDVFIFFWSSFAPDFSDLEELKKNNKRVIFVFVGDDVRWHYSANQEFKKYGMPPAQYENSFYYSKDYLIQNLKRIRYAEKYSDAIFSRLDQSQLLLRPYYRWNMMVYPKDYVVSTKQQKRPLVIHAPSGFVIKGSSVIIDTINRLKREGLEFDFKLMENIPHAEFKDLLQKADMLIDQLLLPGTGKVSTEALAYGKVVLSHMAYDKFPQKNPKECPIIDVNPETLYEKLKFAILNQEYRQELARQARGYVEKHLDAAHFCGKVLDVIEHKHMEYDYHPDFFRNEFIPESPEYLTLYNDSIRFVEHCDWYKHYVKPGRRDGLIF